MWLQYNCEYLPIRDKSHEGKLEENIAMIKKIVKMLQSSEHPVIAPIEECLIVDNNAYVMTYKPYSGDSLETALKFYRRRHLIWIIEVMIDICDGLEHLHNLEEPYFMSGFSPEDIFLVGMKTKVLIWNMNFYRHLSLRIVYQTLVHGRGYDAPENFYMHRRFTPQVDIFFVGAILHHAITDVDPHLEQPGPFPEPKIIVPHLPQPVEDIVMKATAWKLEDRYATIAEMKADLEALPKEILDITVPNPEKND